MIRLRPLMLKDAPLMLEWMHDPQIASNFQTDFINMTLEHVTSFIKNSWSQTNRHYAVVDETDEYLGTMSLKNIDFHNRNAEYAVCLRRKAQGTNAAMDATKQLFEVAFQELKLHKVYLNVYTDNLRANRFYQKAGFVYEGCSKDAVCVRGVFKSLNWYGIIGD